MWFRLPRAGETPRVEVTVRPVRPMEHVAAGRLVVAAYAALPGDHMNDAYAAELADVGRRAVEAEVLVAVGTELLGCVTLVPDASSRWAELLEDGEAGIRMLAVEPRAWGRGVGRLLVESCIDRSRELGKEAVFLHSTPWMAAAHRLYRSVGFERVPTRDWLPVPDVPLLAFQLNLANRTD